MTRAFASHRFFAHKMISEIKSAEQLITCLKEFLEISNLNQDIRDSLSKTVVEFQFFNSVFQKYQTVVQKLRLSSHLDSDDRFLKMTSFYVNSHWMLFVLAMKEFLTGHLQSPETLLLLGAVTVEMLQSEDLISDHLMSHSGGCKVTNALVVSEVCAQYGIKNKELLVKSTGRLTGMIRGLKDSGFLGPKWNSAICIQQSADKLETLYQKSLQPDELDLRFFVRERQLKNSERPNGSAKATPMPKQKLVYKQYQPEVKLAKPRTLDYDSIMDEPPKVETIKPPSGMIFGNGGITDNCFQRMVQSPYRTPMHAPETPMTKAMELYNWFSEAVSKPYVGQDGNLLEEKEGTPLGRFVHLLDAELQVKIMTETIEKSILMFSDIETPRQRNGKPAGLQPDQVPKREEKQLLYLNFYYYLLEQFIIREEVKSGKELTVQGQHPAATALKSVTFHKSLVAYSMETLFYVLNQRHIEFQSILETINIKVCELYEQNIATLNFETLVPQTLKKHFFDIEKLILSYHIWEKQSPIYKRDLSGEYGLIFERAMVHAGKIVSSLGQTLGYPGQGMEKVWELFKEIMSEKRQFFTNRFIEQVILCCFYVVSKISGLGVKFQEIIVGFQKCFMSSSPSLINAIIFQCFVTEEERLDVITFYNRVFIVECEKLIHLLRSREGHVENQPMNSKRVEQSGYSFGGQSQVEEKIVGVRLAGTHEQNVSGRGMTGARSPQVQILGSVQAGQGKAVNVLRSPLRDLMSTPFLAYNKDGGGATLLGLMSSPNTNTLIKMGSPTLKMPVNSKKILNLRSIHDKEEPIRREHRAFEKKDAHVPKAYDTVEDKLRKFL